MFHYENIPLGKLHKLFFSLTIASEVTEFLSLAHPYIVNLGPQTISLYLTLLVSELQLQTNLLDSKAKLHSLLDCTPNLCLPDSQTQTRPT